MLLPMLDALDKLQVAAKEFGRNAEKATEWASTAKASIDIGSQALAKEMQSKTHEAQEWASKALTNVDKVDFKELFRTAAAWEADKMEDLQMHVKTLMEGVQSDPKAQAVEDWISVTLANIEKELKVENGTLQHVPDKISGLLRTNPEIAVAVGVGLIGIASATLGPAIFVGAINMIGFSASGPVAGSVAAGLQSAIYGAEVAGGSAFALAQASAMGGVAIASGEALVANVVLAALGGWLVAGAPMPALLGASIASLD